MITNIKKKLFKFLLLYKWQQKQSTTKFVLLVRIQTFFKKKAINNLFGLTGFTNVQGEEVKPLDVISNDFFVYCLKKCQQVYQMVSEEEQNVIKGSENGIFNLCFDPLDGSSNIEVAIPVGSIFSIYEKDGDNILLPGNKIIAAGYTLYGR
jgi:fructose-1,6-bisphosphatase I